MPTAEWLAAWKRYQGRVEVDRPTVTVDQYAAAVDRFRREQRTEAAWDDWHRHRGTSDYEIALRKEVREIRSNRRQ